MLHTTLCLPNLGDVERVWSTSNLAMINSQLEEANHNSSLIEPQRALHTSFTSSLPVRLSEVDVEVLLKEDHMANTCPRFIWIGYGNFKMPE